MISAADFVLELAQLLRLLAAEDDFAAFRSLPEGPALVDMIAKQLDGKELAGPLEFHLGNIVVDIAPIPA